MTWMDFWVSWLMGAFFAFTLWCLGCVSLWWVAGACALLFGADAVVFGFSRKKP